MNPTKGIVMKLSAVTLFFFMAVLIKASSEHVPPGQAVFFRSFFAIPVIVGWLIWQRELATGLKVANPMAHFWRGLVGTMGMGCGFAALGMLPLPEVTALEFAAPLLTVIFAAMFLGEQVRVFRLTAVAMGLIGVIIVLSPRLTLLQEGNVETVAALGAIVALTGAIFKALAQIHIRNMVRTERTAAIVFYFSITSSALALVTIPFGWVWPTGIEAAMLIGAGVLGGLGQLFLTSCYRYADASVVAPFDYASMVLALVFGYLLFAEAPTRNMLIGAGLVVFAGLVILYRERKLGLLQQEERARARKGITPQG